VDLLVGAGAASVVEESYVGFEQDFGLAPAYRRGAESGRITLRESCCYTILQQLRAAEYGLPFLPVRGIIGTGIAGLHPEYREIECPFTDVALIHALAADRRGNVHLARPLVLDERFTFASKKVVVTVERIASEAEVAAAGVVLPYFAVTAVVEAPHGAHPTSCYPHYAYDRRHLAEWVTAAATDEGIAGYLDRYVHGTEEGYLKVVGEERLEELTRWSESDQRWQELLS